MEIHDCLFLSDSLIMKPRSPLAVPWSIDTLTPPKGRIYPSKMERPLSVLGLRGVKITEVKDLNINPNPVMLEESEVLMEEYLSPRKLVKLALIDDDSLVHFVDWLFWSHNCLNIVDCIQFYRHFLYYLLILSNLSYVFMYKDRVQINIFI